MLGRKDRICPVIFRSVDLTDASTVTLWPGFVDEDNRVLWLKAPEVLSDIPREFLESVMDLADSGELTVCACVSQSAREKDDVIRAFLYTEFTESDLSEALSGYVVLQYIYQ